MIKKDKLYFGWSEVDLTPDRRVMLEGQFYDRISQYVETRIYITALAIEACGDQAIICSCDMTHVVKSLTEKVREILAPRIPDFDTSKLIINATHTHTSIMYSDGSSKDLKALSKYLGVEEAPCFGNGNIETDNLMPPLEAFGYIAGKIADAAEEAWKNRAPGGYIPAFGRAAVGMNRRVVYKDGTAKMWGNSDTERFFSLEGGNDNGIEMLFIYGENEKAPSARPSGVILNIACPSQILEQRYFISSDYWGKVKALLRRSFGDDFKLLPLCSPAGDLCPRDLIRWVEPETPIEDPNVIRKDPLFRRADPSMYDVKGSWRTGRRIAREVEDVYGEDVAGRPPVTEAEFAHVPRIMKLPLRRVTEEENAAARKALADFAEKHGKAELDFNDSAAMHVHAGIADRYELQKKVTDVDTEVHVMRLGDIAFATDPFELFLDFANIIRARSVAAQTFLVQLACDAIGYLPTEKAERGGHYSAYVSSGTVGHEGGYQLVENTLEEIGRLFAE
ncbi:MAG: hypothetical protein J5919_04895 [Clostridia bacterium]|nr:hypothetical protein [Clostridia bacterium]